MNIKLIYLLAFILAPALLLSGCFEDEFTEEDLLDSMSHAELNIILNDATESNADLSDFEVSIVSEGERLTDSTDASGIASFPEVKLGEVPVSIKKEGYISVSGTYQFASVDNPERSQQTLTVPVIPSEGEHMATITGSVKADTDLTEPAVADLPDGIRLFELTSTVLPTGLHYEGFSFTAVSEGGEYAVEVPAQAGGLQYQVHHKSFVLDQQLAINRFDDQSEFPKTEPDVVEVSTEFELDDPNNPSAAFVPFVQDAYAVVAAEPAGNNHAVLEVTAVDANGGIANINIVDGGGGYTANTTLPVSVEGITRGSGADVTADTDAGGSVTAITIGEEGSNYSTENVNVGPSAASSNIGATITVQPGNEHTRNINYGTGTHRDADIQ